MPKITIDMIPVLGMSAELAKFKSVGHIESILATKCKKESLGRAEPVGRDVRNKASGATTAFDKRRMGCSRMGL